MTHNYTILIDTREKKPFEFKGVAENSGRVRKLRKGLKVGDYTILNYENQIAIERKARADFYQTFGLNYQRFCREMTQINEMPYGFLVVEATLKKCLTADEYQKRLPQGLGNTVLTNYLDFLHRFNRVRVQFCGTKKEAATFTRYLLESCYKRLQIVEF